MTQFRLIRRKTHTQTVPSPPTSNKTNFIVTPKERTKLISVISALYTQIMSLYLTAVKCKKKVYVGGNFFSVSSQ